MSNSTDSIKIYRKLWHMSAGWVPLVYYHFLDRHLAILLSGIFVIIAVVIDLIRLFVPRLNNWFYNRLHMLIREDERKSFNTSTWFVIAVFLAAYFFEKQVTVVVLLFLAFGDPVAAIIGAKYGTRKIMQKSLQGSLACFFMCFILAQMWFSITIAFWAALCATIFELLSSKINDNLAIPFFSGIAITLLNKEPSSPPLHFAFLAFQVYLLFVIATYLLGIVLRHVFIWLYRRSYEREFPDLNFAPSVSIIKPIKEFDEQYCNNLKAFCTQEYQGDYELIFAMEEENEAAREALENLLKEYPNRQIKIVHTPPSGPGRHGKIRNVIAAMKAVSYDFIVISDIDVAPSQNYIARLVRPFKDEKVGLVTAVPVYFGARNLPAALASLMTSYFSFTIYYPLGYFEKLDTALGSTLAIRRSVLAEIGGFESVSNQIADDHMLAGEVHKRGYRIILHERPVQICNKRSTWRRWLSEVHRRNVLFHTYKPQVYPIYLFQAGIFHALIYWLIAPSGFSQGLLIASVAAEILSFLVLNAFYVRDAMTYLFLWLIPPLSVVGPILWLSPFFTSVVTWSNTKYYVAKNGVVTELETP